LAWFQKFSIPLVWFSDGDWVFANPQTGKPYHQESRKKRQLRRVAELIGLPDRISSHLPLMAR
jgi:hypothetical protein